jgi:PHD/YefM family antitoxin component YafN of YafNO toxin-antitoxin module
MAARIDLTEDTQSLAIFRENAAELIEQLETTHRPITLTVDGQPKAILQNPAAYQRLLDLAAASDAREGIRQGLADLAAGRARPLDEVFDEMRAKYAIPR